MEEAKNNSDTYVADLRNEPEIKKMKEYLRFFAKYELLPDSRI